MNAGISYSNTYAMTILYVQLKEETAEYRASATSAQRKLEELNKVCSLY